MSLWSGVEYSLSSRVCGAGLEYSLSRRVCGTGLEYSLLNAKLSATEYGHNMIHYLAGFEHLIILLFTTILVLN